MSGHTCHAHCGRECPPALLTCPTCWRLVAPKLGREIYRYFNPAQCTDDPDRPAPTGEWHVCADLCLVSIWLAQGRHQPGDARLVQVVRNGIQAAQAAGTQDPLERFLSHVRGLCDGHTLAVLDAALDALELAGCPSCGAVCRHRDDHRRACMLAREAVGREPAALIARWPHWRLTPGRLARLLMPAPRAPSAEPPEEFGAPRDGWCVRRWVPGVLVPPGTQRAAAWSRACMYRAGRRVWQGPKRRTSKLAWAPEPDHPAPKPGGGEIVSSLV